ncbi:MAG: hypothetical protein ABI862_17710 [Ilumatobacteraceae bacterium]
MSSLRNWAKDRLGEQEDLLRSVERAIVRLTELECERMQVIDTIAANVVRLCELGLDEQQVAAFVGVEVAALRSGRSKPVASLPTRRPSAAPVNGQVES